ncbi:MAG TPA: HupE/UreJ family protein [Vicinamibacteria bacterium]|nr:HupE/UreJ family protein [Vicinamibacteria bacterium]
MRTAYVRRGLGTFAVLLLAGAPPPAAAHDFAFTDVTLQLRPDGTFQADVVADLDALALGVDASADSAELAARIGSMPPAEQDVLVARLGDLMQRRLRVRFDDGPAPFEVSLPERGRTPPGASVPSALGLIARLEGRVPDGARAVSFFASRAFPPVRLTVVTADGTARPVQVMAKGDASPPVPLTGEAAGETSLAVAVRFLRLGFTHILPGGLDHVLFVLGLALLSSRPGPLVAQVSAFTLAHTLTLALAVYGVVSLPAGIVEPLIALSIVYVAVENVFRARAGWTRLAVVFAFGLLHGLGFAGVLSGLGWPEGRRLAALVSFNLGVELGQLAVIALALGALAVAGRAKLARRPIEQGLSIGIAAVALYWTVQRLV